MPLLSPHLAFPSPHRILCAVLAAQTVLTACGSAVHAQPPVTWPTPAPTPTPVASTGPVPPFQAPSAANCARPVTTREVPGPVAATDPNRPDMPPGWRGDVRARLAPEALSAPAPSPAPRHGETAKRAASEAAPAMEPHPMAVQPVTQPAPIAPPAIVTAGMVDDNADFSAYLGFRQRTHVAHRARDVSERYLLEVRDAAGRSVPDAEVAVQSVQGATMWARTDAGGRAWIHPHAFDPSPSRFYEVTARKDGQTTRAVLQRGQKHAVEAVFDSRVNVPARARLDLVFLVDATGSMADEIDKLKATLRTIAADVGRLPSQPDLCFGLVAYRDKGDEFLIRAHDLTNDLNGFQGVLNALRAAGGGDYPEAMSEALHDAVHALSWRGDGTTRLMVLLADAPPHLDYGGPHYDDGMMAALGKGIKVFSVGASGLDKQGEYIQRQIAQYTGGRFVFLTYGKATDPASGPGRETVHDVRNYSVDTLDRLIVRLVTDELARLPRG